MNEQRNYLANSFQYWNPVSISFGANLAAVLPEIVRKRRVLLVTSSGWMRRGVLEKLGASRESIVHTIDSVPSNPDRAYLRTAYADCWQQSFDCILAIGSGSVLDAAKIFSVATKEKDFAGIERIIDGPSSERDYQLCPLLSVPTTAGSGSEVTPWATVWDTQTKQKSSLHLPDLWSEAAIYDPSLCLSLSPELTAQTGLDALSHALESIWNKNRNPISINYATRAAKLIVETLPQAVRQVDNPEMRSRMMYAAMLAGLAFSNTQTALAHAVSYYVTLHKGTPHGIACSFTLPRIMEAVVGKHTDIDLALLDIFGTLSSQPLKDLLLSVDVATSWDAYGIGEDDLQAIHASVGSHQRAGNCVVGVSDIL